MNEPALPPEGKTEPEDFDHRFIIEIDPGTTNSAMACIDLASEQGLEVETVERALPREAARRIAVQLSEVGAQNLPVRVC